MLLFIGAGHNGLTAEAVLARNSKKVLVLEKNDRVGGMAITRELFKGYRHNVGAWALIVFRDEMLKKLNLEKYGLEMLRPESSYVVFGDPADRCFIGWTGQLKAAWYILKDHGFGALKGLGKLDKAFKKCVIPGLMDPSLVTSGEGHTCTIFSHYYTRGEA
jgi:phytoene dehydrogenase-like protein